MLRIYRIATRKLLLEPSADSLKYPGSPVNDRLAELDDRRTISVCTLTDGFSDDVHQNRLPQKLFSDPGTRVAGNPPEDWHLRSQEAEVQLTPRNRNVAHCWTTGVSTFRNPIPCAEQRPVSGRDPHGPYRALIVIKHLQIPDWLAGSNIHGKPVIHIVKTDLIAARLLFSSPKSSVGIQVQLR